MRAESDSPVVTPARAGSRTRVTVELTNGCTFTFPADLAQGLAGARDADLAGIELQGNSYALHRPTLDIDLAIPDLMASLLGTRSWMARQVGRVTPESKANAARRNRAKGGRPREAVKG